MQFYKSASLVLMTVVAVAPWTAPHQTVSAGNHDPSTSRLIYSIVFHNVTHIRF